MNDQNIWTLVITWGTIQCLLLSGLLIIKKEENRSQRVILSIILLIIGYQSFNFLYSYFEWYHTFPHLIWSGSPIWFLIGPLLYFFERYSTAKDFKLKVPHTLHLAPFLLAFFYMWRFYLLNGDQKIAIFESYYVNYADKVDYFFYAFIICGFIYGILTYINFRKYFKTVGEEYSADTIYSHKWILGFLISFIFFWLITLIYHLLLISNFVTFFPYDYVTYIYLTIFIQAFGITSAMKPDSFFITPVSTDNSNRNDSLDSSEMEHAVTELKDFMCLHKPYLNPELRINDLSKMTEIPTHRLSQIINNQTGKNFFEFINDYRIKEVKQRIPDPSYSNLTLNAIARECGFNSSASFYRVFKQSTGLTPKQFLKNAS